MPNESKSQAASPFNLQPVSGVGRQPFTPETSIDTKATKGYRVFHRHSFSRAKNRAPIRKIRASLLSTPMGRVLL